MDVSRYHERARKHGVNPVVYWIVRAVVQPFFHLYFRLVRIGREHVPSEGPVIFAANHRSFLDPFIIGTLMRRPVYYVAKRELFSNRLTGWFLNSLGAFPVNRGASDEEMVTTAKAILARGDAIVIFPEGTRIRPGTLGEPKRGIGRMALETGAAVVPIALIGTEAVRRGWRIRPHRVRIRVGRPLRFPRVESASRTLAAGVTARIWPHVMLQWEWLGGVPPLRRAAIVGAGSWGTALAVMLSRAGLEVDLGTHTREQADALRRTRANAAYLPGVELPDSIRPLPASELELSRHDLVCFAVPARALPAAVAAHGASISPRTGVLVLSKGLAPPLGTLPSAYVAERVSARAIACLGGPAHAADALTGGASLVLAGHDASLLRRLGDALRAARFDVTETDDATGVELAGAAKNAAALAAATAGAAGPNVAGAAAGKVFAELQSYGVAHGARAETFAGLAGTGDLVATVLAEGSRNRRAGELLGSGVPSREIEPRLGQAAESVASVPLLAERLRDSGVRAPTLDGLAKLIEGEIAPERWVASVTAPQRPARKRTAKAA